MPPNAAFETDAVQRCALHSAPQRERWADSSMSQWLTRGFIPLLVLFASTFLAAPFDAAAQSPKVARIGFLALGSGKPSPFFEALRQGLRERGWIEGHNIAFEDHSAVGHYGGLADAADELVRRKIDVIVTSGGTATQAARRATATIPIVTVAASDPVEAGLAVSLARPGGNVTGLTTSGADLVAKRLELLKETFPGISRIAVLWNSESRAELISLRNTEAAAKLLGLTVQRVDARRAEDFEKAFATMVHERAGAVAPVPSTLFLAHRAKLAELAAKHHLPSTFSEKEYVEAGGLISYGPDRQDAFRRLAVHVDKILKGAKPGELPIEQPTKLELVINMKTAKALGIAIPRSLLLRADRIVD